MTAPTPKELRDWAGAPTAQGFVPVRPGTLRAIADKLETVWVEVPGDNLIRLPIQEARLVLWQAMQSAGTVGNPTDDKLVVAKLGEWNIYLTRAAAPAGSREAAMVVLERGADGTPTVWCDPEIADLVGALNAAGIRTVASCSGHGEREGCIALADGRELVIRTPQEVRANANTNDGQ